MQVLWCSLAQPCCGPWWISSVPTAAATGVPRFYLLMLIVTFVIGFITALIHAKDAWATMPAGLILSLITFVLAVASVWLGFSTLRSGAAR